MRDDKFEELRAHESTLGALRDDPRLTTLRQIVADEKHKFYDRLARDLAAGRPIDQRWLDEKRGWIEGAEDILDEPYEIERKLQRELAKRNEGG